jgi:hypothetical protein
MIALIRVNKVYQYLTWRRVQLQNYGSVQIFYTCQSSISKEKKYQATLSKVIDFIRQDDEVLFTAPDRIGLSLNSIFAIHDQTQSNKSY